MTDTLAIFAEQVTGVAREVGTEGKLGGQAEVPNVAGTWKDLTDRVNLMAGNLTDQVRNIAQVTTAVASGDLAQKITADAKGEILELKNTINTMVDQLSSFADEVTRVAREVGTEGKLGGQAEVKGVSGTWRDLTENVNLMAGNLTDQVRNIAQVADGGGRGRPVAEDLRRGARARSPALADTINTMVDRLRSFAAEVTRVAREVGTEGMLGGQAEVEGVSGTWRELTENVNLMADEPDRSGAQHRPGHDGGGERRPVEEDHGRRAGRDPRAEGHHQHDGRPAQRRSPPRSRAWRARSAPRASSAARPRSRACPARGAG